MYTISYVFIFTVSRYLQMPDTISYNLESLVFMYSVLVIEYICMNISASAQLPCILTTALFKSSKGFPSLYMYIDNHQYLQHLYTLHRCYTVYKAVCISIPLANRPFLIPSPPLLSETLSKSILNRPDFRASIHFSLFSFPTLPPQGTMETVRVVSMDKDFHVECYRCHVSSSLLQKPHCYKVKLPKGDLGGFCV